MIFKKIGSIHLALGALSMVLSPVLVEAAPVALNHYSDYGVIEQSSQGKANNPRALSISNDPFGYSGAYTDSETGLQALQARYYNPMVMRFISMDTYLLMNRYAYANENPIMNDDPSGHNAVSSALPSGASNWLGTFAGTGAGMLIGLIGGVVATAVTGGISAAAMVAAEGVVGGLSAAGGQAAQDGIEHKSVSPLQLGVSAVIGAVSSSVLAGGPAIEAGGPVVKAGDYDITARFDSDNIKTAPLKISDGGERAESYTPEKAFREFERYVARQPDRGNPSDFVVARDGSGNITRSSDSISSVLSDRKSESMRNSLALDDPGDAEKYRQNNLASIERQRRTLQSESAWKAYFDFRHEFLTTNQLNPNKVYVSLDGNEIAPELREKLGI